MKTLGAITLSCLLAGWTSTANADGTRLFLALGYDDIRSFDEPSAVASLDFDFGGFGPRDRINWRVSAIAMQDGDYWLGGGINFTQPIGAGPWYYELGFAPGYYFEESFLLGGSEHHFPVFKSHVSIGFRTKNGGDVAMVLSHHSDAFLLEHGPVTESVFLRYGWDF